MSYRLSAIAAAVALGLSLPIGFASAQEKKDDGDTPVDYSEDPSYKAARDFFRVLGADQPRQSDQQNSEETTGDIGNAWPEGSTLESWEYHYLILHGENYLPVEQAYVTPFVTLFSIAEGYMPTASWGTSPNAGSRCKLDDEARAHVPDNGRAASTLAAADEAAVGTQKGGDLDPYTCPVLLGELSAGTQVMDKHHNVLAEQWYSEDRTGFVANGWPWEDNDGISAADEAAFGKVEFRVNFLAIPEGGPERLADPAIYPLHKANMTVVDRPYRRSAGGETGGNKQGGKKKKPLFDDIPELPMSVTEFQLGGDDSRAGDASGDGIIDHADISQILKALEDKMDDVISRAETESEAQRDVEFLLIHRADPDMMDEHIRRRAALIADVLRKRGKTTLVSFGQEAPICNVGTDECWAKNRSTVLYTIIR